MQRYVRLSIRQVRMSLALAASYRYDFLLEGALSISWAVLGALPLFAAFSDRGTLNGWTYAEALVVFGWFTVVKGVLDGAITPSIAAVFEHIRLGTLDFILLKPADSQFLVSTAKVEPWKAVDVVVGVGILVWALGMLGRAPSASEIALSGVLFAVSVAVLYSFWLMGAAAGVWVMHLGGVVELLTSLWDFARWPVTVFNGVARTFFTIVFPLALMTTYPAEALLGRLTSVKTAFAVVWSLGIVALGRFVWHRALLRYTSASS